MAEPKKDEAPKVAEAPKPAPAPAPAPAEAPKTDAKPGTAGATNPPPPVAPVPTPAEGKPGTAPGEKYEQVRQDQMAKGEPSPVEPARAFSTSGAPVQVVPDVEANLDHPAVDNDPRARTSLDSNRIDFNNPLEEGHVAVARRMTEQGVETRLPDGSVPK